MRSRVRSHRLRRPSLRSAFLIDARVDGHAEPGDRLRRERQRLGPHHLRCGSARCRARQQVEHHVRAEPGRADAEPGVAGRVGDPSAVRRAEERAEACAQVDRAAPGVAEPDAVELRERLEEVLGQQLERLVALVELGLDLAAEVVDRVVAAEQDPVVGGLAGSSGTGWRLSPMPCRLLQPIDVELLVGQWLGRRARSRRPGTT